ncbi:MAG: protein kinase [Deltaproteobacteria bacterium]|nr:protein kinase [Deltaproteobacteria bacterium]
MPESRYRITDKIAAGGMAEVFKGVAESLQGFRKTVAIKRILPSLTRNTKFVTMFLDEARLSLFLQHANIVQVFDIGHADDTYFIVMEYVDGVDLKAVLEWRRRIGRRLTIGQTIYLIMEVCKGLAYAHDLPHPETGERLGIVHRDVSPANVLISRNGEVKLADFGLAKAASQLESTDPGVVKGKMSYLSPEAARGENVDHRADIFSVGILLYEMLTSKRLFYGDTDYQTVELVRNAKIPPIAAQNPEVEPEFEEICRKALARRTEDRFQSATDLQDALAHYLFSRGLKMIQRDIAEMVRTCIEDQATQSTGGGRGRRFGTVDNVLHKELEAFASFDFDNVEAQPVAPVAPAQSGGFIDPRAWSAEADWPDKRLSIPRDAIRETTSGAVPALPRDTIQEMQARTSQVLTAPAPPVGQEPSPLPSVQVLSQPTQLPMAYPPVAPPMAPKPAHRGLIFGAMAGAVVIGAMFAYWLFSGR